MASAVDLVAVRASLIEAVVARVEEMAAQTEQVYQHVVPKDTGRLASAYSTSVSVDGTVVVLHGEVDDDVAPHGKFIDQPVDEIVPVQAKVLHWFSGGGDVFAHKVTPSRVHEGWWQQFVDLASEVIHA